jgi:group I intron endonuclease
MKPVNIYKATCLTNGKLYFGQTVQTVPQRWNAHLYDAFLNSDLYFHRALRKYGEAAFQIEKIAEAPDKEWGDYLERMFILVFDTTNREAGYNMTTGGEGGLHLPENKAKIGKASKAWWAIPENKARASASRKGLLVGERNPMFGKHPEGTPHTEETKKLLSEQKKAAFADPEYKARMSAANTGKHHTEEGKANISKGLQGNQYRKGIPHSPEVKARIKASMEAAWDRKRSSKVFHESQLTAGIEVTA